MPVKGQNKLRPPELNLLVPPTRKKQKRIRSVRIYVSPEFPQRCPKLGSRK